MQKTLDSTEQLFDLFFRSLLKNANFKGQAWNRFKFSLILVPFMKQNQPMGPNLHVKCLFL